MPPRDPYDGFDAELESFERAVRDFHEAIAGAPPGPFRKAVKTGSPSPIVNSPAWTLAVEQLAERLTALEISLVEEGMLSGLTEIRGGAPRLSARIADLAARDGGRRAVKLAADLDGAVRKALRKTISRAAKEYVQGQELGALRRLEAEVRSVVGVTAKQAARIERWRARAAAAGTPPELLEAGFLRRTEVAKKIRAAAIADRGVIEAVSYGRHQSWVEAVKTGELPADVKKVWRHQSDKHVRASHRAQAAAGPIPLKEIYSIQGVMHPPSKDRGCRCFENLYYPRGER